MKQMKHDKFIKELRNKIEEQSYDKDQIISEINKYIGVIEFDRVQKRKS